MTWFLNLIILIITAGITTYLTNTWWVGIVICFILSLVIKPKASFLFGFLAIFILWFGLSFYFNYQNDNKLASAIAEILPLGGNSLLLILFSSLIGALPAGFASWSGSILRKT